MPVSEHTCTGFAEVLKTPNSESLSRMELLLFYKYYDARSRSLRYVHSGVAHKVMKLSDFADKLCIKAGLPVGTPLRAYEEVSVGRLCRTAFNALCLFAVRHVSSVLAGSIHTFCESIMAYAMGVSPLPHSSVLIHSLPVRNQVCSTGCRVYT